MRHATTLDVLKRAIRSEICDGCFKRQPLTNGHFPSDLSRPRPCEPDCQIFANLPVLWSITRRVHDPLMEPYEHEILERICLNCHHSDTAGDYCSERSTASCPLSCYGTQVVETIERVTQARERIKAAS